MEPFEHLKDIPSDWRLVPFGDVARTQSCDSSLIKGKQSSFAAPGLYPAFSASGQDVWTTKPCHSGDAVIVSAVGARCGKCFRASGEWSAVANTHIVWPDTKVIDPDFLWRLLNNENFWVRGQSAQPYVQVSATKGRLLPLPPLSEQKKIVHILSTVQRAIGEQEQIIQTTTELKKALMNKFFTEGLGKEPQKKTEIGLIPESWELVELGDVIRLFAGFAFKSQEGVKDTNTQLLRMGNLYQNTLDLDRAPIFYPDSFAATYKRFVLEEGDLVMSLTGTSGKEDYGFTVRIPDTGKSLLLNQRVTRIDITDDRLQKDFAHHFLLSRKFLDFLYPTAKGMKQANLSTNAMKKLKIVLPDKQEQNEIAACFKSLDQKIVVAGRKVAALQDLFRTLLHELMTAKTRVHEPN